MKKVVIWLFTEVASFIFVTFLSNCYESILRVSALESLKLIFNFKIPFWILLIVVNMLIGIYFFTNYLTTKKEKNMYSEADRLHDIEVFNRLMKNFPENDFKFILEEVCNTGYVQYTKINFLDSFSESTLEPQNKFLNKKIQISIAVFQKTIFDFLKFIMINFHRVKNNLEVGRISQFESIGNYSERDEKILELMEQLRKYVDNCERSFYNFRICISNELKI